MGILTKLAVSPIVRFRIAAALLVVFLAVISAAFTPAHAQEATPTVTPEPTVKDRTFVGQVADSQAFIGFQIGDSGVRVFVCDGTQTSVSYWHWFTGQFDSNGSLEVTARDGEHLSAQYADDGITGTVTLGDKTPHDFTTILSTGSAGLIRTEFTIDSVDYVGGWISLQDGQVRGGVEDKKGKKKPLIVIIAILIG